MQNIISEANKANLLLKKLARASAWAVLVGVVVLVISGWGITQTGIIYRITFGLVDRRLADAIHRATNGPLVFFFLSHVLINIKVALSRGYVSRVRVWAVNSILIIVGVLILAITIYMEYFRLGG